MPASDNSTRSFSTAKGIRILSWISYSPFVILISEASISILEAFWIWIEWISSYLVNPNTTSIIPLLEQDLSQSTHQTTFLRRGTLALLGSRPGMGKTTIALQIASNITDAGGTVLVFSLRQSVSQVSDRVYAFKRDLTSCSNFYTEDRVGNIDEMKLVMKDFRKPVDLILVDCLQDVYYLSPKRHPVYSSPNACAALKVMARHHNRRCSCADADLESCWRSCWSPPTSHGYPRMGEYQTVGWFCLSVL